MSDNSLLDKHAISGGIHSDKRGSLIHFNDFDMSEVKRFYIIKPGDNKQVRAWQGHKKENKWFYCNQGVIKVKFIEVRDWASPDSDDPTNEYILRSDDPMVVKIPGGCVNGFQAMEKGSSLMVFSDMDLSSSIEDDFRFPLETWNW